MCKEFNSNIPVSFSLWSAVSKHFHPLCWAAVTRHVLRLLVPLHKHKSFGAHGDFIPEEMRCHLLCKGKITIVENMTASSTAPGLLSRALGCSFCWLHNATLLTSLYSCVTVFTVAVQLTYCRISHHSQSVWALHSTNQAYLNCGCFLSSFSSFSNQTSNVSSTNAKVRWKPLSTKYGNNIKQNGL